MELIFPLLPNVASAVRPLPSSGTMNTGGFHTLYSYLGSGADVETVNGVATAVL